ncbi:MAG: polymorphic toxin-type HINT domain-containing protein [Pirellulaceae bacterium]|nr:polymorphic toxin-type HINT domain-containing protein [Pirellulaceae bacterium]
MGAGKTSSSSVRSSARDINNTAALTTTTPSGNYAQVQTHIADLRVGMRVAAFNPEVTSTQRATFQDPDQAIWRTLVLELPKAAGGVLEITMPRPLEWLEGHQAQVGRSIHLDMSELGATGQAKVLGIYPCPAIQEGPGQVVTATFAHPATHQILNVTIGDGPDAETIGVTETHPFWSVKHNAFVPIGQLSVGDEVLTLHGQTKRIETLLPRPGPAEKVYNLEVHGEHTYFVGHQQLLVHNNYIVPRHFSETDDGVRLFKDAMSYRRQLPGSVDSKAYRNIVTADVIIDGQQRTVRFLNTPGGMHSEERLISWFSTMRNERGRDVKMLRIFSDRIPCNDNSANCLSKLNDAFGPDIDVYYNILRGAIK